MYYTHTLILSVTIGHFDYKSNYVVLPFVDLPYLTLILVCKLQQKFVHQNCTPKLYTHTKIVLNNTRF